MVICCYAEIEKEWTGEELTEWLLLLPLALRDEALRKRQWIDRQLAVAGKLLLKEVLARAGVGHLQLTELKYNSHQRPYFDAGIDFNIAHSGNVVICCATDEGKIGIDIEQIKPIGFDDYTNNFTFREWDIIQNYPDPLEGFYDSWTRKEAVLKAIGTGLYTPLNLVDTSDDTISHNGIDYHIQKINIREGYKCHVATTAGSKITACSKLSY